MADEQNTSPILPADASPEVPEYDMEKGALKSSVEALMARLGLSPNGSNTSAPDPAAVESAVAEMDAVSGEGEPDVPATKGQPQADEEPYDPAKEDWSKFDLDPNIAHYYPKSKVMEVEEGVMGFVAPYIEFHVSSHNVNKNLAGLFISEMVNGREQWQLSALVPNGSGLLTVVLMRQVRRRLPHPVLLPTKTNVPATTDEELAATEEAGLAWAGQEDPEKQAVLDKIAAEAEAQAITLETAVEGADAENA